jgi:hypothetical protein
MKTLSKFNLVLIAILSITFHANCQTNYQYKGKSKMNDITMITLSNGSDSIVFTEGIQKTDRMVRQVFTKNGNFVFRYNNSTKRNDIFNKDGVKVGTSKGFYDITLQNEKLYDHKGLRAEWEYICEDKKVMHGSYKKIKNDIFVENSIYQPLPADDQELLSAISLIYGMELVKIRANMPLAISAAMACGVLAIISASE